MGTEAGLDKPRYEKEWAAQEASLKLDPESRKVWESATYTFRPLVYFNKILVAWNYEGGNVRVKNVFTVVGMSASFRDGVWIKVRDRNGKDHMINHIPRLLPGTTVFAWVPYFNELRFHSNDWTDPSAQKSLRLACCFKTQHSPHEPLREGQTYLSELHVFRRQFPEYANARF